VVGAEPDRVPARAAVVQAHVGGPVTAVAEPHQLPVHESVLAVRAFALGGGRTRSFDLQLSDDARSLVTRHGQLPVRVQVNARDAVGNAARIRRKLKLSPG
jgi:hypothetical protein